jgi:hypothetical protein
MGDMTIYVGGCLCGALRYEAQGEPTSQGYCFCGDCRRASGSGFIPFLSFPSSQIRISGESQHSIARSVRGTDAVRNRCAKCGSLVFGGVGGRNSWHTVYAGSLDEPSMFRPQIALFVRDKPDWVLVPPDVKSYQTLPGL